MAHSTNGKSEYSPPPDNKEDPEASKEEALVSSDEELSSDASGSPLMPPHLEEIRRRVRNERKRKGSGNDESHSEADEDGFIHSRSRSQSPIRSKIPASPSVADTLSNAVVNFFSILASLGVFAVFLVGSYDFFKNVESNKCEMTWMFQYPKYVPIPLGSGLDENFPMYHLHVYTESKQRFDEMSSDNYKFTGIPVLYIPGNAGSYGQVRSLASVSLWKYLDGSTPFHFDFFTVDLNEEFSGLYGYSLQRQVEYTKQALARIVNLYEEYHKVVLVGHSMGGVIAKAVALGEGTSEGDGGENSLSSNLIYTLAAPHSNPVVILDPEQDLFYFGLKRNWTKHNADEKVTLVSVAGGDRDFLVPSKFTRWPFNTIHVKTTGIPGVWASTDHLCIVWCKQFVLTTVRSLFDLVELQSRNKYYAITDKSEVRNAVLNYHFVNRSSGNSLYGSPTASRTPFTLNKMTMDQVEVDLGGGGGGVHCVPSGQRSSYALFSIEDLRQNATGERGEIPEDQRVIILTTNTKDKNWLLGCLQYSSEGECLLAENLSQNGKIIPHIRRRRKMANLHFGEIQKYSHLVVRMDPHPFKTCVMLETYSEAERTESLGGRVEISHKIFYNLTLIPYGFLSYLIAWKVEAKPEENLNCPESHNLLAQFNHGPFQESRFLKNESLTVRFHDWNVTSAHVTLFLEPTCRYTVKTSIAPLETAGQLFRLLWRYIPSFYAGVLLMTLYFQKDPDNWSSFHILLISNAYHLSIFPGFLAAVLLHLVPTDWPMMVDKNEYSVVVPILCFSIAYSLVLAVSTGTWYAIITGGTAIHAVIIRVISSRFGSWIPKFGGKFSSVTEHVTEAAFQVTLTRFPLTIAVILLALSFSTCGSLGIAAALVLYLVRLFKIYEDLLEDLLKAKIANVKDNLSPLNFHFSSFMLWLVVTALNIPSLLHWTRGLSTETSTQWDLSMYLCLLLLPTVAVLWQDFVPKVEPNIWKIHRYIFYTMGMACVFWGTHRLYVTAFIITFVFLTLAICQLASIMLTYLTQTAAAAAQNSSTAAPTAEENGQSQSRTEPAAEPNAE